MTPAQLWQATACLISERSTANDRFGVAVSGGPDSLGLLLLARDAFPGRLEAATVDHGLRPQSTAEAAFVAEHCQRLAIPHTILRPATAIVGSLQASARTARYLLLEQWRAAQGIDWIMTAHHADDQLETLVLRLNRSSGVTGLSSIRRRQGRVLRPLLAIRHQQLVELVTATGIAAIDDPSNHDDRFDRARLRHQMAGQTWLSADGVAASVAHLADADEAVEWAASQLANDRIVVDGDSLLLMTVGLPMELRRRLVIRALGIADPDRAAPRGAALDRALSSLNDGNSAILGNVKIKPIESDRWRFDPLPQRRGQARDCQ